MAKPEIRSIEPNLGPTGGQSLVEILGSGFRTIFHDAGQPDTAQQASAAVEFGGQAALHVAAVSDGRLHAILPPHAEGVVDVVVRNLDAAGLPLPGEETVAAAAFTYLQPSITGESDLARTIRTLIRQLRLEVLDNVSLTVHSDFADDGDIQLALTHIASLPALVLVGPEMRENRFFSINQLPEQQDGADAFVRRREPRTVDLSFVLAGVSDHTVELLNLLATTQLFFHRNKYLHVDRDPKNPAAGRVGYEMDIEPNGELRVPSQPNASNIRSFSGTFVIRGVDIERFTDLPESDVVERGRQAEGVSVPSPAPFRSGPSKP